jgi:hypothetical protein
VKTRFLNGLLSPIDAHKACPDLFPAGVGAAKKALQRSEHGDISLGRYNHRGMSPCSPVRVTYRPAGAKLKTRTALVALWALDGFRAKLEPLVGLLVHYETEGTSGFAEVTNASGTSVLACSSSPPEAPVEGGEIIWFMKSSELPPSRSEGVDGEEGTASGWRTSECPRIAQLSVGLHN